MNITLLVLLIVVIVGLMYFLSRRTYHAWKMSVPIEGTNSDSKSVDLLLDDIGMARKEFVWLLGGIWNVSDAQKDQVIAKLKAKLGEHVKVRIAVCTSSNFTERLKSELELGSDDFIQVDKWLNPHFRVIDGSYVFVCNHPTQNSNHRDTLLYKRSTGIADAYKREFEAIRRIIQERQVNYAAH